MTIQNLLNFIGKLESRNDPNAVWGGVKKADRPSRPLTEMTVAEVLAWQDSIDRKYMSEAAGEWQFLEDTLRGLYREAGVPLSAKFNLTTQVNLATALLKRRGLDDYLAGRISAEKFAQNLSKEWASLPCITRDREGRPAQGQSYYAGDGLNKAHTTIADFLDVVRNVKGRPEPEPRESKAQSKTLQATGVAGAGGAAGVATAVGQLDGTAQLVVIGAAVVVGLALLWIARERVKKWAAGDR